MRVKINSHLDTLEQNILQKLDDTEDKIKSKIEFMIIFYGNNAMISSNLWNLVMVLTFEA
jgi:hypothetical protein